jgi:uncharacterized protein YecT (DUF1311 family)
MQPRYRGHRITAATAILCAFALLSLLASVPATGGPLNDCYRGAENRLDVRPCLEVLLTEADAQLIEAEQFRRQQLAELANVTGRDAALKAFEQAAKDFRVFRESACRLARIETEPGTGAGDFELDCLVRMTRSWIHEIRSHSSLD